MGKYYSRSYQIKYDLYVLSFLCVILLNVAVLSLFNLALSHVYFITSNILGVVENIKTFYKIYVWCLWWFLSSIFYSVLPSQYKVIYTYK